MVRREAERMQDLWISDPSDMGEEKQFMLAERTSVGPDQTTLMFSSPRRRSVVLHAPEKSSFWRERALADLLRAALTFPTY